MQAGSFFGYKCPQCNCTIDVAAIAGGNGLLCPQCKVPMVPDPNGRTSAAKVYCVNCKASFGLVNSDKCPQCGGPFSSL